MKSLFKTKLIILGSIALTAVMGQIATEGLVVAPNTVISFEGVTGTKPRNFIGIKGKDVVNDDLRFKDEEYAKTHTFTVVSGLCGEADSISLQTFEDKPRYVVPNGKDLALVDESYMFSERFKKGACFRKKEGFSAPTAISIESIAMPGTFLQVDGNTVRFKKF